MTVAEPMVGVVAAALRTGGPEAVRRAARQHRGPIVEPAEVPNWYRVTFVFVDRDRSASRVGLVCAALPDGLLEMEPIGDMTFVATMRLPAGARVTYHFCPRLPPPGPDRDPFAVVYSVTNRRIDVHNPRYDQIRIPSLRTRILDSVLVLPGAGSGPPRHRGELRHGEAMTTEVHSAELGHVKRVVVYRPARLSAEDGCPVVLLLESADEWGEPAALFDELRDGGSVGPFVGVSVGGGKFTARMRDLGRRDGALGRFVLDDVLPMASRWAGVQVTTGVAAGFSAGALGVLNLVLQAPGTFDRAALISGAFHLGERMDVLKPPVADGEVTRSCETAPALPARVYLAAGQYEDLFGPGPYAASAGLAAVLARRGVTVRFDTGPTGHDTISARAHLASGLPWLL